MLNTNPTFSAQPPFDLYVILTDRFILDIAIEATNQYAHFSFSKAGEAEAGQSRHIRLLSMAI